MSLIEELAKSQSSPQVDPEMEKLLEEKKAEVEAKHGSKVIAFAIRHEDGSTAYLFLKRPNAMLLRRFMDKMMVSVPESGKMVLDSLALKEYSDPRFFQDNEDNAVLILTACSQCAGEIQVYHNVIKKK